MPPASSVEIGLEVKMSPDNDSSLDRFDAAAMGHRRSSRRLTCLSCGEMVRRSVSIGGRQVGDDLRRMPSLDQEQSAYDALKETWAALPGQTQTWCDEVAKSTGGGSYMILNGCVEQENSAAKKNSARQFRR
jgi:hypothetical protein